ncbi:MAG TPA: cupin domain-containing protein [Vicinamibacterales bacterium]|nr:cupin domain-containing protein [Vicinamibacterales bacterium]
MRRLISVVIVGMLMVPLILTARAQAPAAPAFASKMLVNNDRVQIQRLSVPAGFRETLQVVPNDQIAIQVTPGDLEVVISGQKTTGRVEPGTTFYVPKNAPHQFLNMGKTPYDVVVVMLK